MEINLKVRENIELRTFRESDAQEFFDTIHKNKQYLKEWLGWIDDDKSVVDTKKYIEESAEMLSKNEGVDFLIIREEKIIGGIGLFPIDTVNKKTQVSYWLDEDSQGQGIMSDSLKIVIGYAFDEIGLNRIEITCAPGNIKSSALPKKLNFKFEGITRQGNWHYDHFVDVEIYSLLKHEWIK